MRIALSAALTLFTLVSVGPAHAKVEVVTTLPALAALTQQVGGDLVHVTALLAPTQDPHFADARPSLMLALSKADLVIANGLDLEIGWLPALLVGSRNARIQVGGDGYLDASTLVPRLEVPSTRVDRSQGDVHPGGNPHFLYDARAAAAVAGGIAARLGAADPANKDRYFAQGRMAMKDLTAFAASEAHRFLELGPDRRRVVSYHKSFPYLYEWLHLDEVATVEPKPGISPDPGHVAKVLSIIKSDSVPAIVEEEFYPTSTAETLAKLGNSSLVIVPGGPRFESGQTYLQWLQSVTGKVYDALAK